MGKHINFTQLVNFSYHSASDYLKKKYSEVPTFVKKDQTTMIPLSSFLPLSSDLKFDISTLFLNEIPQVVELHATVPQVS